MRLMRWLAVSRSLGRASDELHRYKMARQGLLPRFGSATSATSAGVSSPGSAQGAGVAKVETGPCGKAVAVVTSSEKQIMNPIATERPSSSPVESGQRFPNGRWTPFRKSPAGLAAAKAAKSTSSAGLIDVQPGQGELSLDLVKPVCNDLTDSDVQVVAGAKAEAQRAGPVEASSSEVGQPVWRRLTAQFFGADH